MRLFYMRNIDELHCKYERMGPRKAGEDDWA